MTENIKNLTKILSAKEARKEIRKKLAANQFATISVSLNIAGYPKNNSVTQQFFDLILDELKVFFIANRINISIDKKIKIIDEAGNFYCNKIEDKTINLNNLKLLTEEFEQNHEVGRLIDVDVFNKNGYPISSHKTKNCLLCEKPATVCMREKNHEYKVLRKFSFEKIQFYLNSMHKKDLLQAICEMANKAILYEVSVTPKPGLVDFEDSGAHSDMNYFTFLNSCAAITPFWLEIGTLAFNYNGDLEKALPEIRKIGIRAENKMLFATNNANTHKGLIFIMGLSVFAIIKSLIENNYIFESTFFRNKVQKIAKNLIEKELKLSNNKSNSHGEITYQKFGLKGAGARYQAENGFPVIFEKALPFLNNNLNNEILQDKEALNGILKKTLLLIIANVNDSNVLYRNSSEAENLKKKAYLTFQNKMDYKELCEFCKEKNLSPGGSADLLALSIFLYFIQNKYSKNEL
ncbi:MAG: triphosphoribosyl-dephospho-CoA synthase [Lutibacter sp.]